MCARGAAGGLSGTLCGVPPPARRRTVGGGTAGVCCARVCVLVLMCVRVWGQVGDVFAGKYRVARKLGWGHFSTVWLAYDTTAPPAAGGEPGGPPLALKVQKSASHYTEAAMDEIDILGTVERRATELLSGGDFGGDTCVVRLVDSFVHAGPNGRHSCMVFEMLGDNLLTLIKRYKHCGIPVQIVQRIALQVCVPLARGSTECVCVSPVACACVLCQLGVRRARADGHARATRAGCARARFPAPPVPHYPHGSETRECAAAVPAPAHANARAAAGAGRGRGDAAGAQVRPPPPLPLLLLPAAAAAAAAAAWVPPPGVCAFSRRSCRVTPARCACVCARAAACRSCTTRSRTAHPMASRATPSRPTSSSARTTAAWWCTRTKQRHRPWCVRLCVLCRVALLTLLAGGAVCARVRVLRVCARVYVRCVCAKERRACAA